MRGPGGIVELFDTFQQDRRPSIAELNRKDFSSGPGGSPSTFSGPTQDRTPRQVFVCTSVGGVSQGSAAGRCHVEPGSPNLEVAA